VKSGLTRRRCVVSKHRIRREYYQNSAPAAVAVPAYEPLTGFCRNPLAGCEKGPLSGHLAARLLQSTYVGCMVRSLIVGGTGSLGFAIARQRAKFGEQVVLTSRDAERAQQAARDIGGDAQGLALDLSNPHGTADALSGLGAVDHLVLATAANDNSHNTLTNFDVDAATDAVTVKLVGFTETIRVLRDRLTPFASVVLFGGLARNRPYPGSTMVTTFSAGVSGLVRTLALELAPIRINAIHPGVVGDSSRWRHLPDHPAIARTPLGRLVTMGEIVDATDFLLSNTGVSAIDLIIDGGLRAS
jgi:NAD(P)-dependent dehydrogenase (short-subunit alcohol dehydrogenase family)